MVGGVMLDLLDVDVVDDLQKDLLDDLLLPLLGEAELVVSLGVLLILFILVRMTLR